MTEAAIKNQIEVIRKAGAAARKSKASALKFLKDAGILPEKSSGGKLVRKKA